MYARAGLALALLTGAAGCAKSMSPESSYGDYYEDGGDGGSTVSTASMGAEREVMAEQADYDSPSRRERRMSRADKASAPPMAPGAAGAPADPMAPPEPAATNGSETKPVNDNPSNDVARHIIYTATMQVSVFNLQDAMERAEAMPTKYGGFVQNMSGSYFVMRIPSAQLRPAMEEVAGLGIVDNRTLDAQDVTEEYLDIETRIEVLEVTQKQMMELLSKARTVEEALQVRQALDEITMELEVLKGRLRRLESLVSFSTLTLNLVERGPHTATPSSNDPFPWVDELGVEATEWK